MFVFLLRWPYPITRRTPKLSNFQSRWKGTLGISFGSQTRNSSGGFLAQVDFQFNHIQICEMAEDILWYIPLRGDISFVTTCYSISRCTRKVMSSGNLAHYFILKTRINTRVGYTLLIPGSSWPADFHILWKYMCEKFVCSVTGAFLQIVA